MWDLWIQWSKTVRRPRLVRALLLVGVAASCVALFMLMSSARQQGGAALTGVLLGLALGIPVVLLIARAAVAAKDRADDERP